jgi:hypothetical protein
MGTVRCRRDGYENGQTAWVIDYIAAGGRRMRETIAGGKANEKLARQILAQREAEAVMGVHRTPEEKDHH